MKTLNILAGIRIGLFALLIGIMAIISPESIKDVSLCIGYILTGKLCPGCGGTRAVNAFIHFDFARAFGYNPVVTLFIFPAFIILYINDVYAFIYRLITKRKKLSLAEYYVSGEFLGR